MSGKNCKVCEGKEDEVIRDMEKTYISSAYSYFKTIVTTLSGAKAPENVYVNTI